MKTEQEIIKLWKELNIDHINFNFNCGGDSMGDTDIEIFDMDGEIIENDEISNFIDTDIYNRVDFYVNSDGHYIGESGYVEITLEGDGEDSYINYIKNAQSEWSEHYTGVCEITLTDKQADFISEYVDNINGGEGGFNINYKKDFILTDEHEQIVSDLENLIGDETSSFYPEEAQGEPNDWFTYTTNEDGDLLEIEGNVLSVNVTREYYVYTDSE